MQKARFTETQIIAILKEAESGMLIRQPVQNIQRHR